MIVHVIPKENNILLETITSNKMTGANISEAWENVLERPVSYICLSPKEFLSPLSKVVQAEQLINYLEKRYWN